MSSSFKLVYWIGLWSHWSLSPPSTSVSSDFMVLCKCFSKIIFTSLYLLEGLAWWDWPFTWWTDQLLSFSAWHCWLGHLTRKNRHQSLKFANKRQVREHRRTLNLVGDQEKLTYERQFDWLQVTYQITLISDESNLLQRLLTLSRSWKMTVAWHGIMTTCRGQTMKAWRSEVRGETAERREKRNKSGWWRRRCLVEISASLSA